jgi:hypothetical protein
MPQIGLQQESKDNGRREEEAGSRRGQKFKKEYFITPLKVVK